MPSVLVVGAGLVGTSVALAARAGGWTAYLADSDPDRVQLSAGMGAGAPHEGEVVDVVVAAVPPAAVGEVLAAAIRAGQGQAYTDVASVKAAPLAAVEALVGPVPALVGGHPIAGGESSGPGRARDDLFAGRPWVLTPQPGTAAEALAGVRALVQACGAVPVEMSAPEHDAVLAAVSHLPQLVASALAAELLEAPERAAGIAGQGLRDMTRIAASDPGLWTQIAAANAAPLAARARRLATRLAAVADALEAEQADAVARLLAEGNAGYALLPGKHGGERRPTETVTVLIGDRPGELARLLADVGGAGINVEDLRVEHTPGRSTGVVELYVTPVQAAPLRIALRGHGWAAH